MTKSEILVVIFMWVVAYLEMPPTSPFPHSVLFGTGNRYGASGLKQGI